MRKIGVATVCEEARCPNIGECWGGTDGGVATATIMLMGYECTRACRFCHVKTSRAPAPLDPEEPSNVAQAVTQWGHEYIVLTSVDRDDVADHGASHIAETVTQIFQQKPSMLVEVLCPDFGGDLSRVDIVLDSNLSVFAHNMETVENLTPKVRDRRAGYAKASVLEPHRIGAP